MDNPEKREAYCTQDEGIIVNIYISTLWYYLYCLWGVYWKYILPSPIHINVQEIWIHDRTNYGELRNQFESIIEDKYCHGQSLHSEDLVHFQYFRYQQSTY
jgi:hypothetical protein